MSKKHKLKSPKDPANKPVSSAPHDRRASELPLNANVVAVEIDAAYGLREGAAQNARGEWVVPDAPKDIVVASLRNDALRELFARKQIGRHQYDAGRAYQRDFDMSLIGGARAIDFTREAVDGGRMAEPISEASSRALGMLARVSKSLGLEGDVMIRAMLGEGLTIAQYAARRSMEARSGREYVGRRFRECLETLAYLYGFTTRKPDTAISCGGPKNAFTRA